MSGNSLVLTVPAAYNQNFDVITQTGEIIPCTPEPVSAAGGVNSVTASAPLASSGGINPNLSHLASGVTPGLYTNASIQVEADGHVTAAGSGVAPVTAVTATPPLTSSGGVTPAVGLQAGATVPISVATSAALTAYAGTAALLAGALALVQSRRTLWAYQPGDASAADGWHIPAAGGGNWVYVAPAAAQTSAQQAAWFVGGAGASDDNSGATSGTPLATKAELVRRCGPSPYVSSTITPLITITYQGADTTAGDPVLWSPSGTQVLHTSPLPAASFTGTLNAVTAKVNTVAPGNALASTFTVATGAVVANMLLVNTTRGNSRAFAQRNLGGGNWQLSQPQTPYAGTGTPFQTEVNTWANGDAIVGYVLNPVDVLNVQCGGDIAGANCILWQMAITPFAVGALSIGGPVLCGIVECNVEKTVIISGAAFSVVYISGCAVNAGICSPNGIDVFFQAGFWQAVDTLTFPWHVTTGNDPIFRGSGGSAINIMGLRVGDTGLCLDSTLTYTGPQNQQFASAGPRFYGNNVLNVQGTLLYQTASATSIFLCTLELNGKTTGYSNVTAAGVTTVHGGITVSGANLDAAAGAAGFGGYAFGGGAVITNGAQP